MTDLDRPAEPAAGPDVWLRPMPLETAAALLRGERVGADAPPWHPDYPLADTVVGVRLLTEAHRLSGWSGSSIPRWWIHQIVADGTVVGDIGFHGPPAPDAPGAAVVEIGYALVDEVHGRGIATDALCRLLALARRDGAAAVVAEADPDNVASRRVLAKAGFRPRADGVFEVRP
jgi:RimJ/RimL family protein N-acetyltransferase